MKALVAIDETTQATQTLEAVSNWANTWGVEVHLLTLVNPDRIRDTVVAHDYSHALTPAGMPTGEALHASEPLPVFAETRGQAMLREAIEVEERLRSLAQAYFPLAPSYTYSAVAERVPEAIVDKAEELHVDLIVVGTHGRTGLAHLLAGSVAEEVIRTAPMPVLVVGPRVGLRPQRKPRR